MNCNKTLLTAAVTAVLGAQAAFADGKITTITTRSYAPAPAYAPVVIQQAPMSTTTTTVTRKIDNAPVLIEQTAPVVLERRTIVAPAVIAPVVQERRVEVLSAPAPSTTTTVTRTTIERN
ncbi:MAG TPA: hypothetical protein V6C97_31055 [Oculatellaceae cyanobacterium]